MKQYTSVQLLIFKSRHDQLIGRYLSKTNKDRIKSNYSIRGSIQK